VTTEDCPRHRAFRVARFAAVAISAAAFLSGCSSTSHSAVGASRVVVIERDYKIVGSATSVPAGMVTFHVENHGPSTHELNIDKTLFLATALPLKPDGLEVEEQSPQLHNIEATELRVGTERDITVRLTPGSYVLFCNFEGHYLGGMHLALNVTA
jgi:uncharacterized cupredoxin-like copper-binding protein